MTVVACLVSNWKCRLNSRLFLRQRTHTMRKKFSTNLAPLNATYASVRLFIRNVNTNSSHFIINKNNTVWHAVSSRFKPDNELTSSVLLERKDVLFKTQSWVLYHDKVRFTHSCHFVYERIFNILMFIYLFHLHYWHSPEGAFQWQIDIINHITVSLRILL